MGVTKGQIEALRPYLEGEQPNHDGEWGLHCPLHVDRNRSASLNIYSGLWFCQVCNIGGPVDDLMLVRHEWLEYDQAGPHDDPSPQRILSDAHVAGWHSALMSDETILTEFMERRGLGVEILQRYEIGYDSGASAFTIPVRNATGQLVNIRRYQLDPPDDRRKIWSVRGHGQPVLYPIDQLASDFLVVCEGEWDALATIQAGIPAITRTAAAKVWDPKWSKLFSGKTVLICHDRDNTGIVANKKLRVALQRYAKELRIVKLPYVAVQKHGKDLTDYWLEGHNEADFWELADGAAPEALNLTGSEQVRPVSVLNTFDATMVGQTLGMRVDVSGKRLPGYLVPEKISYSCDMQAGAKCKVCPMANEHEGNFELTLPRSDPLILKLLHVNHKTRDEELRIHIGAVKCGRLNIEIPQHVTVEELYVRPAAEERNSVERADYTNRRILVVGHHDVQSNSTVDVVGTTLPSPKTSHNEFQAWDATVPPNALDSYAMSEDGRLLCEQFAPTPNQRPLDKVAHCARDLSANVTRIIQRDELHIMLDLVWHSPLWFMWGGKVERGWLDVLVVGDTRTGKSEVASALTRHYGLGEMVSCESASFAGIVGGLDRVDGEAWIVTWGVVPANDRGLVVLDEISGLSTEQISQMSSIRSSGVAELIKIRTERTMARTRLIWMGNPREARMNQYGYGAQAIAPLIGNNEDVARFDLAFSLQSSDVPSNMINQANLASTPIYSADAQRELIRWIWTRKPEQVVFAPGTSDAVFDLSVDLGDRFVENPPLIQAANVRFKLLRVAAAIAGRTFSCDDTAECLVVRPEHVEDAYAFISLLYEDPNFGYAGISDQRHGDVEKTVTNLKGIVEYICTTKGLKDFLLDKPTFKARDLPEFLAISSVDANGITAELYSLKAIHREGPLASVESVVMRALREETRGA